MEQNFKNHTRYVPAHHIIAPVLLLATTIGATRNLLKSLDDEHRLYNAALILVLTLVTWIIWWYTRAFAIKAQDRVILLEERLRYQQLTGAPLDARLRPSQVIALRFAPDAELPALARRAAEENMSSKMIKQSIQNWKGDYHRV